MVMTNSLLLNMAIEIVSFPINSMVIFHIMAIEIVSFPINSMAGFSILWPFIVSFPIKNGDFP